MWKGKGLVAFVANEKSCYFAKTLVVKTYDIHIKVVIRRNDWDEKKYYALFRMGTDFVVFDVHELRP